MSALPSLRSRPLLTLLAMAGLSVFVAAPTPGDVGGCSSSAESQPVVADDGGVHSAEFNYFDEGLCANFCETLRDCNSLCASLQVPPPGCDDHGDPQANPMAVAFAQCVRGGTGTLRPEFGFFGGATSCPHQCPAINGRPTTYTRAYGWDVQACGDAVLTRACASPGTDANGQIADVGTLGSVLVLPPLQCLNVCQ